MTNIITLSYFCLVLTTVIALQTSVSFPSTEEVVEELEQEIENSAALIGQNARVQARRHSGHQERVCSQLASVVTHLYSSCRKKASGLDFTKLDGGYYYFDTGKIALTWYQARQWCNDRGMQLASLETAAERNAIIAHVTKLRASLPGTATNTVYWTGGNALANQDPKIFKWISGGKNSDFSGWVAGAPTDESGNTEFCVGVSKVVDNTVGLDDLDCTLERKFICEVTSPCADVFKLLKKLPHSSSDSSST